MRGMETLGKFEIYIPREAEVKTVPIGSLRVSLQQRLGVQRSHCRHRRSNASAIWISPVVIRERASSPNKPDTSDMAKYNMASVVTQELKTVPGPYHMAFVSSNCVALRILGEFLEVVENGKERIPAQRGPLPHGTASRCPKDAIIIHQKRIFLSFTKPPDKIRGREHFMTTPALNLNPQKKLILESPAVSPKQTCHPVAPDAACDHSWRERAILQRFGVTRFIQVTLSRLPSQHPTLLPSTSQQQSTKKDLHTNHNADKEVASNGDGSSTKTPNTDLKQKVKDLSQVKNDPMNLGDEQSPSEITNTKKEQVGGCTCATYSPKNCEANEDATKNVWEVEVEEEHGTDHVCDVKGKEEIEDGSGIEPHVTDFNMFVIEEDDSPSDTAEDFRESLCNDSGMNAEMEDSEDGTVGSRGQSCGADLPLVPAFSTPEPHYGFDFDQLAREEAIDRIRAKLRESEAALCSLRSLR